MYFREYFCSFSSKSYYFYILGVSHLNAPGCDYSFVCKHLLVHFFEHKNQQVVKHKIVYLHTPFTAIAWQSQSAKPSQMWEKALNINLKY